MRLGRRLRITVYRPARYHVHYGVRDWRVPGGEPENN